MNSGGNRDIKRSPGSSRADGTDGDSSNLRGRGHPAAPAYNPAVRTFGGGEYHEPLSSDDETKGRAKTPSPPPRTERRTSDATRPPPSSAKGGSYNRTPLSMESAAPSPMATPASPAGMERPPASGGCYTPLSSRGAPTMVEDLSPPLTSGASPPNPQLRILLLSAPLRPPPFSALLLASSLPLPSPPHPTPPTPLLSSYPRTPSPRLPAWAWCRPAPYPPFPPHFLLLSLPFLSCPFLVSCMYE